MEAIEYIIQLILDANTQERIRSVWRVLAARGINPLGLPSDAIPHVPILTSARFPLGALSGDLDSLAAHFEPFEITFSHFGIFQVSHPVLFLGVTHTATLTTLHRRIYDLISPTTDFAFAKPDASVFHCALGFVLRPQDLRSQRPHLQQGHRQ